MPEITVIISAYNLEEYLGMCFSDLEQQSFKDFEVIIVNDCSRDNTSELAAAYVAKHLGAAHLITTPQNLGCPGRARNFALDSGLVRGKYIIFLDGDDTLEPDFLEKLHTAAVSTAAEITLCAYDRFEDATGRVLCQEMRGFPTVIDLPSEDDVLAFINGSLWNKLILTAIIGDTRMPDFRVGEDLCFLFSLYRKCRRIACLDDFLIHYRVHTSSVISNTDLETIRLFSAEMSRLLQSSRYNFDLFEVTALAAFIHIGISMAMRAYDNQSISNRAFLVKNKHFLQTQGLLRGRKFLKLCSLAKHGIRGISIWVCKQLYRINMMSIFLGFYTWMKRTLKIDVKF